MGRSYAFSCCRQGGDAWLCSMKFAAVPPPGGNYARRVHRFAFHGDQALMADGKNPGATIPSLADMQHWTWLLGRLQQQMMEQGFGLPAMTGAEIPGLTDPATIARTREFWFFCF